MNPRVRYWVGWVDKDGIVHIEDPKRKPDPLLRLSLLLESTKQAIDSLLCRQNDE